MKFWSVVWIALSAFVFFDFISCIFMGGSIGEMLGGTSSPVVVAIAEKITGMSSWVFWLLDLVSVVVCGYILYVCSMVYLHPEKKVRS